MPIRTICFWLVEHWSWTNSEESFFWILRVFSQDFHNTINECLHVHNDWRSARSSIIIWMDLANAFYYNEENKPQSPFSKQLDEYHLFSHSSVHIQKEKMQIFTFFLFGGVFFFNFARMESLIDVNILPCQKKRVIHSNLFQSRRNRKWNKLNQLINLLSKERIDKNQENVSFIETGSVVWI